MTCTTQFISIDWGTTHLRLRLIDRASGEIIQSVTSDMGALKVYDDFISQDVLDQRSYWAKQLLLTVQQLSIEALDLPIIISGMASSSIGLKELPYASFSFDASGQSLIYDKVSLSLGLTVILVSGVSSSHGMIRGEETLVIGLAEHMDYASHGLLILPGTHSKHMIFEYGTFTGLKNYMTGELFDVLSNKSILAKSVQQSGMNSKNKIQFIRGLDKGRDEKLSANLLSVRANEVISGLSTSENYYFLSGLLIGDELRDINKERKIYLSASEPLYSLYKIALQNMLPEENLVFFDEQITNQAIVDAHMKILKRFEVESSI